jgi:hypothetical protein
VWQDKRADIARSVEALADKFRPAMRAGWLKYIQTAYMLQQQHNSFIEFNNH